MKFLCLAYEEEQQLKGLSREDWHALRDETLAYVEVLRKHGQLVGTHALQSAQTAATVRVRDGERSVMDGPFAETKEHLGGYYLVEARDLDAAIDAAARIPGARTGRIEIRPLMEFG